MAYDIGPKIGIDGEAEFRKAISQISTNIKTLGTEMKVVTSAYEGNEKSMEALTAKHQVLEKTLDAQNAKLAEQEKALKAATEKYGEADEKTQKWQQAVNSTVAEINKLNNEISGNEKAMDALANGTGEAGDAMDDLGDNAKTAGKNVRDAASDADKAGSSFGEKLAGGLEKAGAAFAAVAKAAAAALGAATAALAGFAKSSLETGANFDASMSQVAATMGKSVDEIGELRDFALDMGATTAFSATQAADALNYMALAGYDSGQAMEALPNVLNLAAAGGMELAAASDMVTDAQSALGLSMAESAELVDKMAMTASKSNTSVDQLGQAILTVGGTAKNLAGGTTELSTALGILADNGIKGAEGGTALRNIILSLSAPTGKAAATLEKLGVSVFDAEGSMRPLNETFGDLTAALSTMTQEAQTDVLSKLFNKNDLKSVNALLSNCGERFQDLSGYINDAQGATEKMAATQLDNLTGDITLMQSALEGVKIAVSDKLTPTVRSFVQFATDSLGTLGTAFREGGLSGAMDALGSVLSEGLAMVVEMLPSFIDAGMQLLGAFGQGIMDNLPVILGAAGEILQMLVNGIADNLPVLIAAAGEVIGMLASAIGQNLPVILMAGMTILGALTDGILQYVNEMLDRLPEVVENILNFFTEHLPEILEKGGEILVKLTLGIIQAIPKLVAALPQVIAAIVNFIVHNLPQIIKSGIEIIVSLVKGIIQAIPQLLQALPQVGNAIINGFRSYASAWLNIGGDIVRGIWQGIQNAAAWFGQQVSGFFGGIVNGAKKTLGIASPSKVFAQIGGYMAEGLGEGFGAEMRAVERDVGQAMSNLAATAPPTLSVGVSRAEGYNAPSGASIGADTLRAALDGMGVYMDGVKVGKLVSRYQRGYQRAAGV